MYLLLYVGNDAGDLVLIEKIDADDFVECFTHCGYILVFYKSNGVESFIECEQIRLEKK